MASIRARTASRGSSRPASIMASTAASMAAVFIRMKSVSVLSRSKTIARIKHALRCGRSAGAWWAPAGGSLAGHPDLAAHADLAVVDPDVEAASRIAAHPRLVGDGRSVAPVVRERQQIALAALHALGKPRLHTAPLHTTPPRPPVLTP